MAFEKIVGNSKIKETLNATIEKGNILHGYMFIGEERNWENAICQRICKNAIMYISGA